MFGVLPQLGIGVPSGNVESKVKNDLVVFAWEQSLKYGHATL